MAAAAERTKFISPSDVHPGCMSVLSAAIINEAPLTKKEHARNVLLVASFADTYLLALNRGITRQDFLESQRLLIARARLDVPYDHGRVSPQVWWLVLENLNVRPAFVLGTTKTVEGIETRREAVVDPKTFDLTQRKRTETAPWSHEFTETDLDDPPGLKHLLNLAQSLYYTLSIGENLNF